jgi:hypothetical protein
MIPRLRPAAIVAVLAVVLSACGSTQTPTPTASAPASPIGSAASFIPVQVTGFFEVGDNRIVFGLADPAGQKELSDPSRTLSIAYTGPSGQTIPPAKQTFIWAIENVRGVYVGHATFPVSGTWTAEFTSESPGGLPQSVSYSFDVIEKSPILGPGDRAPSVKTPTLADVGGDVAKISSDTKPVPAFYQTSEADALAAKKPFVLIFATPRFCQTASCGPTLDKLKPVAAAHPEMTFINVEPYQLTDAGGSLQPVLTNGDLTPVEATIAFKLQSEPYVFVVGSDGVISSAFELVFSPEEIEAAIKAVE